MNHTELRQFIIDRYSAEPEYPWARYPDNEVYRHGSNQKWFALIMKVSRDKIGLSGDDPIDVVNLKCEPALIASLQTEQGIYPAYHMNKLNWITVSLDGSVADDKLKVLVDMSYELTAPKLRKRSHK